jgi:hypothetical protein
MSRENCKQTGCTFSPAILITYMSVWAKQEEEEEWHGTVRNFLETEQGLWRAKVMRHQDHKCVVPSGAQNLKKSRTAALIW